MEGESISSPSISPFGFSSYSFLGDWSPLFTLVVLSYITVMKNLFVIRLNKFLPDLQELYCLTSFPGYNTSHTFAASVSEVCRCLFNIAYAL